MQTAYHIYSLVRELREEIHDTKLVGTEFYKKERMALFIFKGKQRIALVFSYHPARPGVYLLPPSKLELTTKEKPWPIFNLEMARVTSVDQLGFDRIIKIGISVESKLYYLIIEALGPNGNIWLLNDAEEMEATLRKREFTTNEQYQIASLNRLNPLELTKDTLNQNLKESDNISLRQFFEKRVAGFNITLAKEVLVRARLENQPGNGLSEDGCQQIIDALVELHDLFKKPGGGHLYHTQRGWEAYPFKLQSREESPEKFKTLSRSIKEGAARKHERLEAVDEEKSVIDAVTKTLKKLRRRADKVTQDIKEAADFEKYKKIGELLQIHFDRLQRGMEQIELPDMYGDGEQMITIALDASLVPKDNVEAYFKRHRKGREGLALLKRRLEITLGEIESLDTIANALSVNFEQAQKQYAAELSGILPKIAEKREKIERLPYKEYQLSTGLTIFVGRDGSDNDRTTFEFGRPYELWFHTQQCPGSHVVMKYPNKQFQPSKREIEETAAIAAFYSKARNDTLVPVIYTERKYVRKPRKAKPGLVTVEREKSVMVAPAEPAKN